MLLILQIALETGRNSLSQSPHKRTVLEGSCNVANLTKETRVLCKYYCKQATFHSYA